MHRLSVSLLCLVAALLLMAGCSKHPPLSTGVTTSGAVTVVFPPLMVAPLLSEASKDDDPVAQARFGLALANAGRHREAGQWFLELSGFPSRGNNWAVACLSAASLEFLKAGMLEAFHLTAARIPPLQDRHSRAAPNELTEVLLQISRIADGTADANSVHPALRTLAMEGR